jgi:predicted Zn-dependent peptidase
MSNSIPQHYTKELKNGLQIVAIPLKNGSGVVSTDVFYRVGSRNEIMGRSGLAHMLEHLNFKSTDNYPAGEFDRIVKRFGGVNNASTSFDITHYFIKSSVQNLDKSLHLYSDIMQNLKLTDEEFQPERDVVLEERYWRTDNSPFGLLYFTIYNTAFDYSSYHWTPIGFTEDIKNWKIEDIREFHKIYYQPKNATVVVAGDIDADEVFKLVEKHFKDVKNCCDIPESHLIEPEQKGEKRRVILKESDVEYLAIGFKIPDFLSEDQVALSVLSELLSSGKSSRLHKKLVIEKQIANSVYAYNMESIDPNLFLFMAIANSGVKAEEVEREIWAEIEKLIKDGVSESELKKVQTNVRSELIYSFESSSDTADIIGSYIIKGDIKPLTEFEERVDALSSQKIVEVAKKYFVKKSSTTVILRGE